MRKPLLILALALFSISLQAQTISSSTILNQADIDNYTWPVTIGGGSISSPVIVTLGENITLNQYDQFFIIESEYVTFNGDNKTVTITDVSEYQGLLQNGTDGFDGYSFVTINNIRVISSNTSLSYSGGWVAQYYFGYNASNVIISNSSSNGVIANYGGGIAGNSSFCKIINSHSSGEMQFASGGIFGPGSHGEAINCFSEGNGTSYCGGIFGYGSEGSASDCYSTGLIGVNGGGIWGYNGFGSANRCYSMGSISNARGGIAGRNFSGTIENSYSTGNIGVYAGGMAGQNNSGTITNCYSTGTIGADAGGMEGYISSGVITNCISEGNTIWNDNNSKLALTGEDGSTWTDIDRVSTGMPYKLSSFNQAIYSPATESIPNNAVITSPDGNFTTGVYSIVSINDDLPSLVPSVTINSTTGMITFTSSGVGTFIINSAYTDNNDDSYQISEYTLNIMSTLPLAWRTFTVTARGNTAWLQWSTASEQNTRDFNVQHSSNGSSWTTISTKSAAGNSTVTSNYNHLHADPITGNNFYRIQQTDIDGKFNYSSIQKLVMTNSSKSFSVINTIVSNGVLQVAVKTPTQLYLFGNDGKLVWQKEFNAGLQHIDLSAFSKGVYLLKGKDAVEKIIIR